jgi:hypothetical protein
MRSPADAQDFPRGGVRRSAAQAAGSIRVSASRSSQSDSQRMEAGAMISGAVRDGTMAVAS